MTDTIKKLTFCTIQSLLFFICAYLFWSIVYPAHIHFHEQYQLFQFSWHYFCETIILPGGFTHYISRFLIQFFYNAETGAAIMATLLTLIQLTTAINIKKKEENRFLLYPISFIPAIATWIFLIKADAMPVLAINSLLVLSLLYICKHITSKPIRRLCEALTSIILFFLAGGNTLIFILIAAAYEIMLSIKENKKEESILIALISLSFFLILPLIGTFIYNYPYDQLFKGYGSYRYPGVECNEREIAIIIIFINAVILQSISIKTKKKFLISSISFILITIVAFPTIKSFVDYDEESIFEYDYLTRMQRWDDIIKKADSKNPATVWEECCLNLALAQKGVLCDKMFHYKQQGRNSLLPTYQMNYMTPMIGGEPYFYIGIVNTAQRFAFEAMEAIPDYQKSARCYKRLAITNIINKRYEVAAEYLRILEKTLYYKDWAKSMKKYLYNDKLTAKDRTLGWYQKIRYKTNFFFNEDKPEGMIAILLMENPHNWMAWQYLFAVCLENKDLMMLNQFVALMKKEWPEKKLPVHVQEALLLSWVQTKGQLDGYPWNIDENVKERFIKFANAANQSYSIAKNALQMKFADTYGYYYLLGKEADYE